MNKDKLIEMYGLEYVDYLDELEEHKNQTIENECENNRHSWSHCYGGYVRCSTCNEELP